MRSHCDGDGSPTCQPSWCGFESCRDLAEDFESTLPSSSIHSSGEAIDKLDTGRRRARVRPRPRQDGGGEYESFGPARRHQGDLHDALKALSNRSTTTLCASRRTNVGLVTGENTIMTTRCGRDDDEILRNLIYEDQAFDLVISGPLTRSINIDDFPRGSVWKDVIQGVERIEAGRSRRHRQLSRDR